MPLMGLLVGCTWLKKGSEQEDLSLSLPLSLFFLFTDIPTAYGSFWARGWIGAAARACAIATATPDKSHICNLLWSCGSKVRAQRSNSHPHRDNVRFLTPWATRWIGEFFFFFFLPKEGILIGTSETGKINGLKPEKKRMFKCCGMTTEGVTFMD